MQQLHDEVVAHRAEATKGAWYRRWRLVSLDGSTLDVADENENERPSGGPAASRGSSAYPQMRFVSLVENGTHVLFGTRMAKLRDRRNHAGPGGDRLPCGRGCCAWRTGTFSASSCGQARATGADLLWRVKKNLRLRVRAATAGRLLPEPHLRLGARPAASQPTASWCA